MSYEVGEGQDVVFAYQLHVVKHKGWRGKYVNISVYKPEAAFLNNNVEVEEGVEVVAADENDV